MKLKLLIILGVVVVIAFFVLWFIRDNNELEVSADNVDKELNLVDIDEQSDIEGQWVVYQQEDVFVGYEIKELFARETLKKTAIGTSKGVSGNFAIKDGLISQANILVDLTMLKSDSSNRDDRMRSEGLETSKYPDARFVQLVPMVLPEYEKNVEIEFLLPGQLTLHGVTKDISVSLSAIWDGKVIAVSGQMDIVLQDFNIDPPNSSFVSVDNDGKIKLQLLFVPKS